MYRCRFSVEAIPCHSSRPVFLWAESVQHKGQKNSAKPRILTILLLDTQHNLTCVVGEIVNQRYFC
ncbi:hypothetical protein DN36_3329 [Vibrio cholerae]|nr:hypothetical protein DN36_3329 [Vibrio cholerae]